MTPFILQDHVEAALEPLGVPINPREAPARALRVTVTPGTVGNRRMSAGAVNRTYSVTVMCIASSLDETRWLAYHVTDRLDGLRVGSPHGTLTDTSYDGDPISDPGTAPRLWSKTLDFTWTMKRSRNGN